MDCSPLGSSVHGVLQARIVEWVDMPSSKGSSRPRDWTLVSCTEGGLYHLSHQGSLPEIISAPKCFKFLNNSLEQGYCLEWEIRQGDLHVFFSNSKQHNSVFFVCLFFPIFYGSEESISRTVLSNSLWPHSPPGSSAHGIVQARILEWVAISFPMYLPKLESPTLPTDSLPSEPPLMSKDGM